MAFSAAYNRWRVELSFIPKANERAPVDTWTIVYLLGWIGMWGGIGKMLGERLKARPTAGFLWCALLGPFGLLLVLSMNDAHAVCPQCLSRIPPGASVCRYCRASIPAQPAVANTATIKPPKGYKGGARDAYAPPPEPEVEIKLSPDQKASDDEIGKWIK